MLKELSKAFEMSRFDQFDSDRIGVKIAIDVGVKNKLFLGSFSRAPLLSMMNDKEDCSNTMMNGYRYDFL